MHVLSGQQSSPLRSMLGRSDQSKQLRLRCGGRPSIRTGAEKKAQAALLRDIFGNPFEPLTIDAARLTPAITELAQTIYEENSFLRMPELAEALEEVGCTNGAVIRHCNELESHVRGCWVIDLILGKA